jgi:hypothetical protein
MEVHRRVMRAQVLLLALMARVRAGQQRAGRSRIAPDLVAGALVRSQEAAVMVLPRRFGWLVGLVGYEAAGRASQLQALLAEPEMAALVRDVPQARRILAPLCRMLGVTCAELQGVTRVRVRRVAARAAGAGLVTLAPVSMMERPGYRPSAKWPKGVMTRWVVPPKRG